MIRSLHISNYALISRIDIDFSDGLNIITGETGAGKSIMLGALNMLLGGKSDAKVISDPTKKSIVEVEFDITDSSSFDSFFNENDLDSDGKRIILRRELAPNGRTRAFINDSPVNLNQLKALAIRLVDIHSQHQNLLLADSDYQLMIIDNLAGNNQLLADYKDAFRNYQHILKQYVETRDRIKKSRDEADFINYQLDELNEIDIQSGEDSELEEEREILSAMSEIKQTIADAIAPMRGEENALIALEASADSLRELADNIPDAESLAARIDSALIELRDIASSIENFDSEYNADPERLEEIDRRLSKIYSLETKHHVESADDLLVLRDKLKTQIEIIENGDGLLSDLEAQAKSAKKNAVVIARKITESRKSCAETFAQELRAAAEPLGMKNLRCEISLTTGKLNSAGMDTVEFLFSFNKNQELLPVGLTASGGEISRIMLALKSIVSKKMNLPTIIFDEIDTGVSGEVAARMGELMQSLGERIQVITITHLPQVAAKGQTHFKVYKQDNEHSTNTSVKKLDKEQRIAEVALMLSGSVDNIAALEAARTLFD